MLPRGESVAVAGQTRVTSVVMGPRETEGIVSVARALGMDRETDARRQLAHDYGIRPAVVSRLRDMGIGIDCIAGLLEVSRRTRKNLEALLPLKRSGLTWREIAARLKLNCETLQTRVLPYECR